MTERNNRDIPEKKNSLKCFDVILFDFDFNEFKILVFIDFFDGVFLLIGYMFFIVMIFTKIS